MLSHQPLEGRATASTKALLRQHLTLCPNMGPCGVTIWTCPDEGTHSHAGAFLAGTCAAPLTQSLAHPECWPEAWGAWQEARQKLMKLSQLVRATDEVAGGGYTALADMAFLYASTRHWFLFSGGYQVIPDLLDPDNNKGHLRPIQFQAVVGLLLGDAIRAVMYIVPLTTWWCYGFRGIRSMFFISRKFVLKFVTAPPCSCSRAATS